MSGRLNVPAFPSSKETTNFALLARLLVDVGTQVLRNIFDSICPPGVLHAHLAAPPVRATLQALLRKRILNPTQWIKLYPATPSSVSSEHFDIILLVVLLRNICGLTPPLTGWDNLPPAADTTVEADIARVKYYRNSVYGQASQASVDDTTFNSYWQDIRDPLVRLGGASYGTAIDNLKNEHIDQKLVPKQWKKDADRTNEAEAVVPAYVLARGDKAVQAYYRALENGKTYDKRVKVFFIGQDRVGKTSLVRSLRGEQFNEQEESTEGVQMHKSLKNVDENAWKNGDVLQHTTVYDHKCAEILSKDLSAKATEEQRDEEFATSRGQTEEEEKDKEEKQEKLPEEVNQTLTADIGLIKRSDREKEGIPEVIASLTEEKLKGDESDNDEGIWPVIWDFAGQAVYHAIHPIFLSPEAVYVLVFDITKNLSDTAQCHVMLHGKKELVPSPNSEDTNLDHIMRWMDMVHSLEHSIDQERAPESLPPVILVGTHADGVDGDPWTEMDTLLDTFCDNNEVYSKHIVEDKFVVDNTRSGTDPQIEELRLEVLSVAGMMPHIKEEIPLQWLHIEKEIYDSANHGMKYVKKREFAEKFYNSEKDDDLGEVLYFLHARGTIIYHDCDSSPDCLVVLDPQWLINVLCQIIEPAAPRRNETPSKRKQRRDLATKGILAEELLHDAFKNLELNDIQGSLLSIMEKFNLICNWRNRNGMTDYLVPCMLTAQPPSNDADSASVYLTFSTNYVPSGLFSRLVVLIGRWASSSCSSRQPQLFARTACFFIGEDHCLCLVCFRSVIKLQVSRHDSSDPLEGKPGLCLKIRSCLTESLENLRTDCHWLQSMSWELCAQCDLCPGKVNPVTKNCFWHKKQGCSHEDCAHYIPLNSSPFCCPDAPGPNRLICKEKFKPWSKSFDSKDPDTVQAQKSLQLDQAPLSVELCNRRPLPVLEGHEESPLALPGAVLESLQSFQPSDVVVRLQESLQLNHASLKQPTPETRRWIRCLAIEAKCAKRMDVVEYLRKITPAGTAGPLLPEHLDILNIPIEQRKELTFFLGAGDEWQLLAERLGMTPVEIGFINKRTLNPCAEVLAHIGSQFIVSAGNLYDVLVSCDFPVAADML